ncbi:glycoside hydrolase family 127 protein [Acrocarpospora catenulata]|uniref:glycoside hydrolase family 127 protein n=1 Tax=Acrocarpospora catenulata TaxID=2836182 RepID=UPI001BDB3329|nr:beta-L-arabinofuranosidase domain-containing protein [Acrocarpospora catenulata]
MVSPVVPASGALTPLGLDSVRLLPGFWGDRRALGQEVIIGHCLEWMEKLGWIGNFRGGPARGREFADSEVYKLLEAMAWASDPRFDDLAVTVVAAQESDGYLNTRWGGDRYRDLEWGHELYCYGHLIQAGVARLRAFGEDEFTEAVRRAADHVCARFLDSDEVCGHPVVEMALVELYRATGAERYLEMARRFVERRGTPALAEVEFGRAYFQDDMPVRQATVFRGHAVRAMYLACGAVDVAVETGDTELLRAIETQWERTVARRTYLTGGMGSRHDGESFGEDFELPPDRAYSETCAAVGSVMLSHRLLLATGDRRYAAQAERTLYNVVAASPALDGRSYFYTNPLHVRVPGQQPEGVSPRAQAGLRAPWFAVSCCPNNVARTFASLPAYLATGTEDGIQIHHPTPSVISHDGLTLRVQTRYPWEGTVTVRVEKAPETMRRITLPVLSAERVWRVGDVVTVEMPVEPSWVRPDPRVDAVRGCVAVTRGPLVYCAEAPGNEPALELVRVTTASVPREHWQDGAVELDVTATVGMRKEVNLRLVPYHRWGNRGPATMRVWIPEE